MTENCGLRLFPLSLDLKVNLYGPRAPGVSRIHWSWLCELFLFVITTAMNRVLPPTHCYKYVWNIGNFKIPNDLDKLMVKRTIYEI